MQGIYLKEFPFILLILLLLAGLTIMVLDDFAIRRIHRRVMLIIVALCFSLVIQNYWEALLIIGEPKTLERTIVSIYGYCVRPAIIVLFFYIIDLNRNYSVAWVLIGLNMAVHLTALFSPICFTIGADNVYRRGPLSYCCFVVSLILLGCYLYLIAKAFQRTRTREMLIPAFNVLVVLIGVAMDLPADTEQHTITYLTVSLVSSVLFSYIWLHQQFAREHERDLMAEQRIQIMTTQIQPHFLYNTLATIVELCKRDPEQAARITEKFSMYLRQNLDTMGNSGLIPFTRELEHTRQYTDIECVRFDHIRVEYDIDDDQFLIPPLTVQPLVENAIRHGVRIREEGLVRISSRRVDGYHEIMIADNGEGFDVSKINTESNAHIGIPNVRGRIEKLCKGSMMVHSSPETGTTIKLRIPADKTKEEHWKGNQQT